MGVISFVELSKMEALTLLFRFRLSTFSLTLVFLFLIFAFLDCKIVLASDDEVSDINIFIEDAFVPVVFTRGEPFCDNKDNIIVPLREMVEYLGGKVDWNGNYRKINISKDDISVNLTTKDFEVDKEIAYICLDTIANKLGYTIIHEGGQSRLLDKTEKLIFNRTDQAQYLHPNPFTPFADSTAFLKSSPHYGLDNDGVFIYNYGSRYQDAGQQYNPAFICSYAFSLYRDYLESNPREEKFKDAFLRQANWLLINRTDYEKFSVWEYTFDNAKFGAKAPWSSAMANGRIISVLVKAYALTGQKEYLEVAERAFRAFKVSVKNLGVATFLPDGTVFYEEVAHPEAVSAKILNGHIFALSGLYDYWLATKRVDVKKMLEKGIKAVRNNLDKYDAGFLSYYSLEPSEPRIFAPRGGYNLLHVHQLLWLYKITNDSSFLENAMIFYQYEMQNYFISTKGSTNPVTNGPNNLRLEMGTKYWSHNKFPTWVMIDLDEDKVVSGISIMGYITKAVPRDMIIWSSQDGINWNYIMSIKNNKDLYCIVHFSKPLTTKYLKVEIFNDNGNNNVALVGIGVIPFIPELSQAICNFDNFSSANSPYKIIDNNIETRFLIMKDGWLIFCTSNSFDQITLYSGLKDGDSAIVTILGSDDLVTWNSFGDFVVTNGIETIILDTSFNQRYFKLLFPYNLDWINHISFVTS